jgi:hypothetical protein
MLVNQGAEIFRVSRVDKMSRCEVTSAVERGEDGRQMGGVARMASPNEQGNS